MKAIIPITLTIPAAAGGKASVLNYSVAGEYFYLESATTSLQVQFDAQLPTTARTGFRFPGTFKRITFLNANAIAVTVTFYVSDSPIDNVSNNQQRTQSSYSLGHGLINLAAGSTQSFSGTNNGQPRKQIVIHNYDADLSLQVLDSGGNVFDQVTAGQEWTFESDADFQVKNANGSAVSLTVGETFYS